MLSKITKLEQDIDGEEKFDEYDKTKNELKKVYNEIAESVEFAANVLGINTVKNGQNFSKEKRNALWETIIFFTRWYRKIHSI